MNQIVRFAKEHLHAAQALSAQQGWPHTVAEWQQMLALGQGLAALHNGHVVGTTLWWTHDRAASLGMVIVDQGHRGQGIAARLVQAALDRIGDLPVVLTATDMAQRGYARLGFEEVGMVDTCRGVPASLSLDPNVEAGFSDEVLALDATARRWDRSGVLRSLIAGGATCWSLRNRDGVTAYVFDRAVGQGRMIGPIVAPDLKMAETLVRHCLATRPGVHMRIDSDPTLGLSNRLPALGLKKTSWGTVMVRGTIERAPEGAPSVYGLASQAYS
ncbi:GNAT family N-acetyltransferase [uncultured Tateyamaria sp.]|uniref:GNAT family N-acetyltransferase n=1 Tax=uncultured Tateyamaria sp. TaxID=455651 RepID=UPI0026086408|nr:GNAT family N-acetyltransferase [uncultured Tateyamaria sp.]